MKWENELEARVAELEDELKRSGIEDALDWERWDEFEHALYAMAEYKVFYVADEDDELAELAELAEESASIELAAFGCIALMDDFEELENFALVDGYINHLEQLFDEGNVGGAEIYEYDELMTEFRSLMEKQWVA